MFLVVHHGYLHWWSDVRNNCVALQPSLLIVCCAMMLCAFARMYDFQVDSARWYCIIAIYTVLACWAKCFCIWNRFFDVVWISSKLYVIRKPFWQYIWMTIVRSTRNKTKTVHRRWLPQVRHVYDDLRRYKCVFSHCDIRLRISKLASTYTGMSFNDKYRRKSEVAVYSSIAQYHLFFWYNLICLAPFKVAQTVNSLECIDGNDVSWKCRRMSAAAEILYYGVNFIIAAFQRIVKQVQNVSEANAGKLVEFYQRHCLHMHAAHAAIAMKKNVAMQCMLHDIATIFLSAIAASKCKTQSCRNVSFGQSNVKQNVTVAVLCGWGAWWWPAQG